MWLYLVFWICIKVGTKETAVITQVHGSFPSISMQILAVHTPFSASEGCALGGSWLRELYVEEQVSEAAEPQKLILFGSDSAWNVEMQLSGGVSGSWIAKKMENSFWNLVYRVCMQLLSSENQNGRGS